MKTRMIGFDKPDIPVKHKFYKYRRRTFAVAFVATIVGIMFAEALKPLILLILYPTLSVLGDVVCYKILGLQESSSVNPHKLLQEEGITPEQLDRYLRIMSKVRLIAYGLSWIGFGIGWFFDMPLIAFAGTYITLNATAFLWCKFSSKTAQPQRFGHHQPVLFTIPHPYTPPPVPHIPHWKDDFFEKPSWYGAPGYDTGGILTCSPTAIGGMSN